MRSAFESWPASSPRSSSAGDSSSVGYEEDDSTKRVRVVGFPESPNFKMQSNELSRFASCCLDERPKRQSSLAQQLALNAFEAEQKPKLRAINTRAKTLNVRTTRRASTPPGGVAGGLAGGQNSKRTAQDDNRTSFEFPSTLPSGQGGVYMQQQPQQQPRPAQLNLNRISSTSSGSEAVAIPQLLTKAYTAPQPLPELSELSPSLVAILQGGSGGGGSAAAAAVVKPTNIRAGARGKAASSSRLLPSPASSQHSPPAPVPSGYPSTSPFSSAAHHKTLSPQSAAERGALAQVAGLREALRQQQEEVARLQLELAKLALQQQQTAARQRSGSVDVQMTPVTPDAADDQGAAGAKSMSPDEDTSFEGFTSAAAAPAHHHHYHEGRGGGRAW